VCYPVAEEDIFWLLWN